MKKTLGFTLLELLIAITVLAFVSMIAWRGLDSLVATRERLQPEAEEARALLAAFGQMERDVAQVASPTLFALAESPLQVRAGSDGRQVMQILRTSVAGENAATAVQTVFYRVDGGVLLRQAAPASRSFGAIDGATLANVRLLSRVRAMRVREWRQSGWVEPGTAQPTAPGTVPPPPTGLEITLERTDGKIYRRVLLVG